MYICRLLSFYINIFYGKIYSGIPSVSNIFDPAQARHFVVPDIGPNCWASSGSKLFAKNMRLRDTAT